MHVIYSDISHQCGNIGFSVAIEHQTKPPRIISGRLKCGPDSTAAELCGYAIVLKHIPDDASVRIYSDLNGIHKIVMGEITANPKVSRARFALMAELMRMRNWSFLVVDRRSHTYRQCHYRSRRARRQHYGQVPSYKLHKTGVLEAQCYNARVHG